MTNPVPFTQFQDCQIIAKTFERGANHSMTEESVFAMFTPQLQTMRSQSKATKNVTTGYKGGTPGSTTSNVVDVKNSASSKGSSESLLTKVAGNIVPNPEGIGEFIASGGREGDISAGVFNSECIPCGQRLNFKTSLDFSLLLGGGMDDWASAMEKYFGDALKQLLHMLDFFKDLGKYVDLCAFLKFIKEFVCIPDLQRILALLSAGLMKSALEMNSLFDLIINLVGPLFVPFLTTLMDTLFKFLETAMKPLECIVGAIQNFMGKIDYNVLFQNIGSYKVNTGPVVNTKQNIPFAKGGRPLGYDDRQKAANFNTNPVATHSAKEQADVNQAEKELRALDASAGSVEASNPKSVEDYRKQEKKATDKYRDAKKKQDQSAVGNASQGLGQVFADFKGLMFTLVRQITSIIADLKGYIDGLFDEFKKLMAQMSGTGTQALIQLNNKMQIIQLASIIIALIAALKKHPKCEDGKEVETYTNQIPASQGMKVFTDGEGNVHIEEDKDDVASAIESIAGAGDPRQKLTSLINFTGDPTLDSNISRAVDALTQPLKVKFKCPLMTSVSEAERVNKWIAELNTQ